MAPTRVVHDWANKKQSQAGKRGMEGGKNLAFFHPFFLSFGSIEGLVIGVEIHRTPILKSAYSFLSVQEV